MKHKYGGYLKDIQSEDLIDELKKRGLLVHVWDMHDVFRIEDEYREDNGILDDIIKEGDAKEILADAQTHLDDNVGMNWCILEGHFIDYIKTNKLI